MISKCIRDLFWDDYKILIFDDPCFDPKLLGCWGGALGIMQRGSYNRKEYKNNHGYNSRLLLGLTFDT